MGALLPAERAGGADRAMAHRLFLCVPRDR